MAKKINPIIYRIGTKNDWKYKYIEKKQTEYKILSFNSIEVNNFIYNYFLFNGLNILFSKLFLNKHSLHIFITYDFLNIYKNLKTSNANINFLTTNRNSINFLTNLKTIQNLNLKQFLKKKNIKVIKKNIKIISYYKSNFKTSESLILTRSKIFNYLNFLKIKLGESFKTSVINVFLSKLIKSIELYFRNKITIFFTLKQIIKNNFVANFTKSSKKNILLNLIKTRKFEKNEFFKEGVNMVFRSQFLNKKSFVIADFLQLKLSNIRKLKTTNYFIFFLKSILKYFLHKYKIINGAKIIINGNLSKKRRSVKKVIKIGNNINSLKLNSSLDYESSTCFTKKGTFGIKVYFQ